MGEKKNKPSSTIFAAHLIFSTFKMQPPIPPTIEAGPHSIHDSKKK